jgi:hypothetical protein
MHADLCRIGISLSRVTSEPANGTSSYHLTLNIHHAGRYTSSFHALGTFSSDKVTAIAAMCAASRPDPEELCLHDE